MGFIKRIFIELFLALVDTIEAFIEFLLETVNNFYC